MCLKYIYIYIGLAEEEILRVIFEENDLLLNRNISCSLKNMYCHLQDLSLLLTGKLNLAVVIIYCPYISGINDPR